MPDYQIYTNEASGLFATAAKTALALSKLRFCQAPFVPTRFTTKEQLEAVEANFDGYPAGGYALTAWTGPRGFPGGGSVITSPLVNPAYGPAGDPPVGNSISAWWIEDATGGVRTVGVFDPARALLADGDGFSFVDQLVIGKNPNLGTEE